MCRRRHADSGGAERSATPLSIIHDGPTAADIAVNYAAIVVTVVSWAIYMISTVLSQLVENAHPTFRTTVETVLYLTMVTLLSLSALIYLVTRKGALMRFRIHQRVPRALLEEHFAGKEDEESITVLIPSYVEEPRVVEKTVWLAALQEFPHLTIALLLDDPPFPSSDENREILARGREIVFSVIEELHPMSARFSQSRADIRRELDGGSFASAAVVSRLADDYRVAARWLENKASSWRPSRHHDVLHIEAVHRASVHAAGQGPGEPVEPAAEIYMVGRGHAMMGLHIELPIAMGGRECFDAFDEGVSHAVSLGVIAEIELLELGGVRCAGDLGEACAAERPAGMIRDDEVPAVRPAPVERAEMVKLGVEIRGSRDVKMEGREVGSDDPRDFRVMARGDRDDGQSVRISQEGRSDDGVGVDHADRSGSVTAGRCHRRHSRHRSVRCLRIRRACGADCSRCVHSVLPFHRLILLLHRLVFLFHGHVLPFHRRPFYLSADSSRVQFDHIIAGEGREVGIMRDDDNRPTA